MTVGGATTRYALDVAGGLPAVIAETMGGQVRQYVTGLAQYDSGTWAYQLPDALGSVRQVVDPAGAVSLAQSYDPFGNLLTSAGSGSSVFGYTGEQMDASTGLVFLRARYYSSGTGRFLTPDPWMGNFERSLTINPYLYAFADPVNVLDPSGKQCLGCETTGEGAELTLSSVYGIRLKEGFAEVQKLLILETVSDYANLLGGPAAFRRNVVLSTIKAEWGRVRHPLYPLIPTYTYGYGAAYLNGEISLPPGWYVDTLMAWPDGTSFVIATQPCVEDILHFPKGSLPTDEIEAKFVLAHEMGHTFIAGNQRALGNFTQLVDLPEWSTAKSDPNPIIVRGAEDFESEYKGQVFADAHAAFLYSRALLNQKMLDWVQIFMPRVLQ